MIAKLLGKIGLPILVKFIGRALSGMNNDLARQAGNMLGEVDTAIQKQQISLDELKEANRHVEKSLEIEAEVDDKTLSTIHQTIRQELASGDRFVLAAGIRLFGRAGLADEYVYDLLCGAF